MKNLILFLFFLGLAACNGQGGPTNYIPQFTEMPTPTPAPIMTNTPLVETVTASPVPTPILTSFSLTYYQLSKTYTLTSSHTVNTIGYCVLYQMHQYCWDNGAKQIVLTTGNYVNYYYYTYWGIASNPNINNGALITNCAGPCVNDLMAAPIQVNANLAADIGTTNIENIFTQGLSKTVNCTLQNNLITCTDFIIDLNQTPF